MCIYCNAAEYPIFSLGASRQPETAARISLSETAALSVDGSWEAANADIPGHLAVLLWLYRDNGKENGSDYNGLYRA